MTFWTKIVKSLGLLKQKYKFFLNFQFLFMLEYMKLNEKEDKRKKMKKSKPLSTSTVQLVVVKCICHNPLNCYEKYTLFGGKFTCTQIQNGVAKGWENVHYFSTN